MSLYVWAMPPHALMLQAWGRSLEGLQACVPCQSQATAGPFANTTAEHCDNNVTTKTQTLLLGVQLFNICHSQGQHAQARDVTEQGRPHPLTLAMTVRRKSVT